MIVTTEEGTGYVRGRGGEDFLEAAERCVISRCPKNWKVKSGLRFPQGSFRDLRPTADT